MKKYRLHLLETIGDYQQHEWWEDYDTLGQAEQRIEKLELFSKFGADWYIEVVEDIKEIDV